MAVLAPTVADLLDKQRAQLLVDGTWFTASTLRLMRRDLLAHCVSLSKRGDLRNYDRAVAAADSIRFVLTTIDSRRAYRETGR
jgi:hypothetical protein